jgi:hypothetical protein
MLESEKEKIQATWSLQNMDIMSQEIQYYTTNLNTVGAAAAMVGGFSYAGLYITTLFMCAYLFNLCSLTLMHAKQSYRNAFAIKHTPPPRLPMMYCTSWPMLAVQSEWPD